MYSFNYFNNCWCNYNNYTPLKVFGKIVAWFFGIILAISLIAALIVPMLFGAIAKNNMKEEQEAYLEQVKQTLTDINYI